MSKKDKNVYVYLVDEDVQVGGNTGGTCHYAFVGTPEEFYLTFNGDFETVRNLGRAVVYDYGATAEKIEKCRRVMTRMSKGGMTEEAFKKYLEDHTAVPIYENRYYAFWRIASKCSKCGELVLGWVRRDKRDSTKDLHMLDGFMSCGCSDDYTTDFENQYLKFIENHEQTLIHQNDVYKAYREVKTCHKCGIDTIKIYINFHDGTMADPVTTAVTCECE